ncbi:GNAT family N-acetyltransferase [Tundrisphaera lichenicola]|uniref:GNAT family N-acetyltransferase n=1 Tax=Tundrisphaera lichenicola TaxID=2029860 RepID=UPI003EB97131
MESPSEISIRSFRPDDAPKLLQLFRDTIRRVNSRDYTPEQIDAWASDEIDLQAWSDRFEGRFVAVAESDGRLVGFGELEADGHIDRFFVSADHQRIGVGRSLLDAIVSEAGRLDIARLSTEASITARPFFEDQGFETLASQIVVSRGIEFRNYRMSRSLSSRPPADSSPHTVA